MREVWQPKTPQARHRLGERSIDRAVIACVGREKVIGQDKHIVGVGGDENKQKALAPARSASKGALAGAAGW